MSKETVQPTDDSVDVNESEKQTQATKAETPKPSFSAEDKEAMKNEILAELGIRSLNNGGKQPVDEVKQEIKAVVVNPAVEKPRKIIFEIKGVVDENHIYNGAYIPGKIVGKHPFNLNQQVTNKNDTFERENDHYVTGLESEFYINDSRLTEEALAKRLAEIKIAKAYLEKKYNKSLDPKNYKFWSNIRFNVNDIGLVYSTHKITNNADEDNLLMYYVILGGGCQDIAISYDEAKLWNKTYYLTVREEESVRNFSDTKSKITANSYLSELMDNWRKEDQLFLLYSLDTKTNHGFNLDTPTEMLIGELNDYIEGKNFTTDKKKKAADFIEVYKTFESESDIVKTKGLFNAALYFGYIITDRTSKDFKNRFTGFNYGSSKAGAIDKLMSPRNIEELSYIKAKVLDKWKN